MKKVLAALLLVAMLLPAFAFADGAITVYPPYWDDDYDRIPTNRPLFTVNPDGTTTYYPWWRHRDRNRDHRPGWPPVVAVNAPQAPEEPVYGRASNKFCKWSTEKLYQVNMDDRSIDFRLFNENGDKTVFLLSFQTTSDDAQTMVLQDIRANLTLKPVFTEKALMILKTKHVTAVTVITKTGESTTYSMAELEAML